MMPFCIECHSERPSSDFYQHPQMAAGHTNVCKGCHKQRMKTRRLLNPEVQAYDLARAGVPKRKAARRITASNWRIDNPLGYRAQTAVGNAVRDGRLKRGPCAICGKLKVRGIHRDYSRPLEIYGFEKYIEVRGAVEIASDEMFGRPRRLLSMRVGGEEIRVLDVWNGSLEPDGSRRRFFIGALRGANTPHEAVALSYGIDPKRYREAVRT